MHLNFWRALTDNDEGWKVDEKMGVWKMESEKQTLKAIEVTKADENQINLKSVFELPGTNSSASVEYLIYPNGKIKLNIDITVPDNAPNLPRVGLQFEIEDGLRQISWFGRGPHENYQDRKTSAAVGMYHSTVDDWVTPYVRPQENGNRCDVRWINFTDKSGWGLNISSDNTKTLSVSAWPYTQNTLENTQYDFELEKHDKIVVNIDHLQMGVGGDNSWGLPVHDKYQIWPGTYNFSFYIQGSR